MIGLESDADIFESDFAVTATFDGLGDIPVDFQGGTEGVRSGGEMLVEAQSPSCTVVTSKVTAVTQDQAVTINGNDYKVARKEDLGTGHTTIWLRTI